LYTGQFQGIPIAGQAQQMIWAMVDSAMGKQDPYLMPTAPIETIEIAAEPSPVVVAGLPGAAAPLPGTRAVTDIIFEARQLVASADSTVAALARASEAEIPQPAEKA